MCNARAEVLFYSSNISRFISDVVVTVWLLLIPDGIKGVFSNGCNVAKCSLYYKVYSLGLYTDKHNLFLTVNLTVNDIDHSF